MFDLQDCGICTQFVEYCPLLGGFNIFFFIEVRVTDYNNAIMQEIKYAWCLNIFLHFTLLIKLYISQIQKSILFYKWNKRGIFVFVTVCEIQMLDQTIDNNVN